MILISNEKANQILENINSQYTDCKYLVSIVSVDNTNTNNCSLYECKQLIEKAKSILYNEHNSFCSLDLYNKYITDLKRIDLADKEIVYNILFPRKNN